MTTDFSIWILLLCCPTFFYSIILCYCVKFRYLLFLCAFYVYTSVSVMDNSNNAKTKWRAKFFFTIRISFYDVFIENCAVLKRHWCPFGSRFLFIPCCFDGNVCVCVWYETMRLIFTWNNDEYVYGSWWRCYVMAQMVIWILHWIIK